VCDWNKVEMARLFVTQGHALDNMSLEQKIELVLASVTLNNIQMVDFLVRDCNICVMGAGRHGDTALVLAVKFAYVQMADLLLPYSAHIDQLHGGRTVLHTCIGLSNLTPTRSEMIRMLLQRGANPQVVNRFRESPLQLAVRFMSLDMVNALLDGGADINNVNFTGDTALHVAVNHRFIEMIHLLRRPLQTDVCEGTLVLGPATHDVCRKGAL